MARLALPTGHPTSISPGCKKLLQKQDEMHREAMANKDQVVALLQRICLGLLAALLAFFGLQAT